MRARPRACSSATGSRPSLSRPLYYELAELALAEGADPPGVWSGGAFFPLEPAA